MPQLNISLSQTEFDELKMMSLRKGVSSTDLARTAINAILMQRKERVRLRKIKKGGGVTPEPGIDCEAEIVFVERFGNTFWYGHLTHEITDANSMVFDARDEFCLQFEDGVSATVALLCFSIEKHFDQPSIGVIAFSGSSSLESR